MGTVGPEERQRFLVAMDSCVAQPTLFVDALHCNGLLFRVESVNGCLQPLDSGLSAGGC